MKHATVPAYSGGYRCGICGKCVMDAPRGALDAESVGLAERSRNEL